jgi:hypothetical protein
MEKNILKEKTILLWSSRYSLSEKHISNNDYEILIDYNGSIKDIQNTFQKNLKRKRTN